MNTLALGTAQRANRLGVHRKRPTSPYADKVRSIFGGNLLEHWPLWDAAGSVAAGLARGANGIYGGVTLGQTGAGDGRTAPFFNGTTGYVDIYTTALNAPLSGQELTISLLFKTFDNAVWTDTLTRRFISFQVDSSNRLFFQKNPNTGMLFSYAAGGITKSVTRPLAGTNANWTHAALTISKSGDALKAYWNGVQEGTTQTGLGTWAGLLAPAITVIGASNNTPAAQHYGWIAHVAIGNRALSAAEVAALAVMP